MQLEAQVAACRAEGEAMEKCSDIRRLRAGKRDKPNYHYLIDNK
jgi:hypothetical protein